MRKTPILLLLFAVACSSGEKKEVEPLCVAGEVACTEGGSGVEVCAADGMSWELAESCVEGAACVQGACQCPPRQVHASESCVVPGVESCPEGFLDGELQCTVEPEACGAGEVYVVGECVAVGVAECPATGWEVDDEVGGCKVADAPCSEGKDWVIGEGCTHAGLELSCGNLESPWPETVPEGDVVWAWAGSNEAEELGTQSRPFKSLAAAVDAAQEGSTVVLGTGTYAGGVAIDKSLRVLGKCAEYVTIDGGAEFQPPDSEFKGHYAIYVDTADAVELAGFTVVDTAAEEELATSGILLEQTAGSSVHDVRFEGLAGAAVDLHACTDTSVHHVEVLGQTLFSGLGPYAQSGFGVYLYGGSGNIVSLSRFEKTKGADIKAENTCPQVLRNHFEGRGNIGGLPPMGVWVENCSGATAVIQGNTFVKKMTHAILIQQADAQIRGNTITGTVTDYDDVNGPAIKVEDSEFDISENLLLENQYASINAVKSEGTIRGNRIESGLPSDPGLKNGDGIIVKECDPGPVVISGNTLFQNTRNGILVTGSIVKIEGNLIAETQQSPALNAIFGAGVNVVDGADAWLTGNSIVGNHRIGVRFDNAYGQVDGNVIADTEPDEEGRCGGGIMVGGAKSSYLQKGVTRNLFANNYCAGIYVNNSNVGTIAHNVFLSTQAKKGAMGIGAVITGSDAKVEENWFTDNADSGVLFEASEGSVLGNVFEGNGVKGRGAGLVLQDSDSAKGISVEGNTFRGNGLAGAVARGSHLELRRNAFIENVPNGGGVGGMGGWLESASIGDVRTNYADGNLLAGFVAYEVADITFSVNYISNTALGSLPSDGGAPVQMAEGIVAAQQSFVSVLYNALVANGKSGLACFLAEGVVTGNSLLSNKTWGIELANSQMALDKNLYRSNGAGDENKDSDRHGPPGTLDPWVPCKAE